LVAIAKCIQQFQSGFGLPLTTGGQRKNILKCFLLLWPSMPLIVSTLKLWGKLRA